MSKVVSLQIGKSQFQVSPATFNKLKNKEMFTIIEGDTYYADRDGDIFKYILRYLRSDIISFPNEFNDGELLMKEAEFYGLRELKKHLENGAGKPEMVTLQIMTPEENVTFYHPGIDILLSWTTGSLATSPVDWETLVKGFLDRLNQFTIYKCYSRERLQKLQIAKVPVGDEGSFGQIIQNDAIRSYSKFLFNVKNINVPMTFVGGFLTSGFSLLTDKSSTKVTIAEKAYEGVRELVFQRIKPVN